jgi:D-methionine transport system ATP-binding protein
VETGTALGILAAPGPEPSGQLHPLRGRATGPDCTVVDLTFHGEDATLPVISRLARIYNVDISILSAAIGTLDGRQIGRMRIELPGRFEDNVVPIGYLREQGIQVDVTGAGR